MMEFVTIQESEVAEIIEKKSKFIANVCYIENIEDAEIYIKNIKKKYYDAKHNCIAYRVLENGMIVEKSSDNGEPAGTAGGPMLNILQKNNLCNIIVVVTRYFGGILLGTGGLVRAYSDATQRAIEKCKKISKVKGKEIEVKVDYTNLDIFKYYCKNHNIIINKIDFLENVVLNIEMEEDRKKYFLEDIENKRLKIECFQVIKDKYINKTVEENK